MSPLPHFLANEKNSNDCAYKRRQNNYTVLLKNIYVSVHKTNERIFISKADKRAFEADCKIFDSFGWV